MHILSSDTPNITLDVNHVLKSRYMTHDIVTMPLRTVSTEDTFPERVWSAEGSLR